MNEGTTYKSRLTFDWITILLSGLATVLGVGILAIATLHWWRNPVGERMELLITAASAFGTLMLAAATFFTVRYNIKSVYEIEKDREKPIVEDEIAKVIQPAIDALESNIKTQSERNIGWVYASRLIYNPDDQSARPSSVFADPSPVAMARLSENRPDLWSQLEKHQELVETMMESGDTIRDRSKIPIQMCVDELNWKLPEGENEVNVDVLVSAVIKDVDEFGENNAYYSFWEQHGEEINSLVQSLARKEIKQLRSDEVRWNNLCKQLVENLTEYKMELQQEYGISESVVDDEDDEYVF